MAANWTLKEKSSGELVVTVEGDNWKQACDKAFKKIAKNLEVKGFRKGHVPESILRKNISAEQAQVQAIDDNANRWLTEGVNETGIKIASRPTLDIKSMDADHAELSFTMAVEPEFEMGQYKDLPYEVASVEVTDEEFNKEMDRLRESYADVQIKETAAEEGDIVNINYEGFKDGVAFEGGKADGFDLELGSKSFIPGFEDQLIGAAAGEDRDLNLTFPEDYHAEDLKGAAVVFKVHVNEVKTKVLPEVDDDFAKDVNAPGVETAEQLNALIRERIGQGKKDQAERAADEALLQALNEGTEVEIPDAMIQSETNNMIAQLSQQISQYGMKMDQYLSMIGQTVEQLAKSYESEAHKNVKLRLLLSKVADLENLQPDAEEVEKEFKNLAAQYHIDADQLKKQLDEELVKEDLRRQKAYDFVKSHVKASGSEEVSSDKAE